MSLLFDGQFLFLFLSLCLPFANGSVTLSKYGQINAFSCFVNNFFDILHIFFYLFANQWTFSSLPSYSCSLSNGFPLSDATVIAPAYTINRTLNTELKRNFFLNLFAFRFWNWLVMHQRTWKSNVSHRAICNWPFVVTKNWTAWSRQQLLVVVLFRTFTSRSLARRAVQSNNHKETKHHPAIQYAGKQQQQQNI